jgi:hypothetical protein
MGDSDATGTTELAVSKGVMEAESAVEEIELWDVELSATNDEAVVLMMAEAEDEATASGVV